RVRVREWVPGLRRSPRQYRPAGESRGADDSRFAAGRVRSRAGASGRPGGCGGCVVLTPLADRIRGIVTPSAVAQALRPAAHAGLKPCAMSDISEIFGGE